MGNIVGVRCSCGYRLSGLSVGCGEAAICYELVFCPTCRRHRSVKGSRVKSGCPKCHSRLEVVELVELPEEAGGGIDLDAVYVCPLCGRRKLSFDLEALFD
jgi:hypothetical protein